MPRKFNQKKQRGIIPAILALIIAGVCIFILVLIFVLIAMFGHIVAGLSGGGDQPTGGCNVGCGFDTSKRDLYEKGDQPQIADATSEEAKNYAINTLKVDPTKIKVYSKPEVENMIRAEVAKQWPDVKNTHGSTQADAQRAILTYALVEDSDPTPFVNKSGRLSPHHDQCTVQLLSITKDKWCKTCSGICSCSGCNTRQEIVLNWDPEYTIYTGVKEHLGKFQESGVSGEGLERWKNTLQAVRVHPAFWDSGAEKVWQSYQNETAYNCQKPSCASESGFGNVPLFKQCDPKWGQDDYDCPSNHIGKTICSSGCGVTSAAMVLRFYGKNDVTPATMAKLSLANNTRPCGEGTSTEFFSVAAKKYGLKYREVDFDGTMQALKEGKPVIAGTSLTSSGHYVVLTGINADGLVMINDPMAGGIPSATQTKIKNVWKHGHLIEP